MFSIFYTVVFVFFCLFRVLRFFVIVVVVFAEYVDGYKAESDAAFNWNFAEAMHEVSYIPKQEPSP